MYYGAIEAGGTKFVCAVYDENNTLVKRISLPTRSPEETLADVFAFFEEYPVESLGVGSFGPIDVNENSDTYGYITSTPKLKWQNFAFLDALKEKITAPIAFTTDVNTSAYGEFKSGSAKGLSHAVYLTVGTGIGAGIIVNGKLLSTYSTPEAGHVLVRRVPGDSYEGCCPFHKDCLEGMASGPALEGRYKEKAINLTDQKEVWEMEANYLAQALMSYTLILRPEQIILGGGVMNQAHLLPLIHENLTYLLAGYIQTPPMEEYVVLPSLGDDAGIMGAMLLGKELL